MTRTLAINLHTPDPFDLSLPSTSLITPIAPMNMRGCGSTASFPPSPKAGMTLYILAFTT